MVGLKVSLPLSTQFFTENLSKLFTQPGEILEAKVETISGRLITLLVGQERVEALLTPDVSPHMLRPGQKVRLKVVRTGNPVVLSLRLPPTPLPGKELKAQIQELIKALVTHKAAQKPLSTPIKLETLFAQALRHLEDQASTPEKAKALRPQDPAHPNLRPLGQLLHLWEAGVFFLPLSFPDQVSWGTFEEETPKARKGTRVFRLRLFLSRLGALEIVFFLKDAQLDVQILCARGEALERVQKALPSLYQGLKTCYPQLKLDYGLLEPKLGSLLARAG